MSDADNLRQRSATPEDMGYILSTWVRSYGSRISSDRRQVAIVDFRRRYVDRVMKRDPHIVVLCSPNSRTTLHAYAVAVDGGLAWCYVTKDLRRELEPGTGRVVSAPCLAKRCIEAALRGYPDHVRVFCAWPWESSRYKFERLPVAA